MKISWAAYLPQATLLFLSCLFLSLVTVPTHAETTGRSEFLPGFGPDPEGARVIYYSHASDPLLDRNIGAHRYDPPIIACKDKILKRFLAAAERFSEADAWVFTSVHVEVAISLEDARWGNNFWLTRKTVNWVGHFIPPTEPAVVYRRETRTNYYDIRGTVLPNGGCRCPSEESLWKMMAQDRAALVLPNNRYIIDSSRPSATFVEK